LFIRAGSRRRGNHRNKSDLDIIFTVAGDPPKKNIYPMIASKLKEGFPNAYVEIGSSYNVINMQIDGLDFDIVLLSQEEFEQEVEEYKLDKL